MKEEKTTLIKPKKKKEKQKEPKNWNLITPIIMLIVGIILLTNSTKAVIIVCTIIGSLITVFGIYHLIRYFQLKNELKVEDNQKLILGTATIFIGITIIILASALEACLRFIIGIILVISGIKKTILSINSKNSITLLEGIILLGMGLYTILAENIVFQIIGVLLIVSSIMDLITYLKENKNN